MKACGWRLLKYQRQRYTTWCQSLTKRAAVAASVFTRGFAPQELRTTRIEVADFR